jgi:hypothetical protein
MFCPKCRSEYREGFTTCSDCGIPLVHELPPEAAPQFETNLIESEEIVSAKYYLIVPLWLIFGYLIPVSSGHLFGVGTSHLIEPTSRYLRTAFHLHFSSASIAFVLYTISQAIIVFSVAFLLSVATGKRKLRLFMLIVGAVGLPLYDTRHNHIAIYHANLPVWNTLIESLAAHLFFTPLAAFFGVFLENQYRSRQIRERRVQEIEIMMTTIIRKLSPSIEMAIVLLLSFGLPIFGSI